LQEDLQEYLYVAGVSTEIFTAVKSLWNSCEVEHFFTYRTSRDHRARDGTGGIGRVWRGAEDYLTAMYSSSTNTWTISSSVLCTRVL